MKKNLPPTYADETKTGASDSSFRGYGRAVIAARAIEQDFDWLCRLRADCFPSIPEVKSEAVLAAMDASPHVRDLVLDRVTGYTIFIVDFYADYRRLVAGLHDALGLPLSSDPITFLRSSHGFEWLGDQLLRAWKLGRMTKTLIPDLERLVCLAGKTAGLKPMDSTLDRNSLLEMNDQEFREFTVRFAVALGDALDPNARSAAISDYAESIRYFDDGYFAFDVLQAQIEPDRYYDVGFLSAFEALESAHAHFTEYLDRASKQLLGATLRGGKLKQEDSRIVLGIQAADIAAGLARSIYEERPQDRLDAAHLVRQTFSRVLLNTEWL